MLSDDARVTADGTGALDAELSGSTRLDVGTIDGPLRLDLGEDSKISVARARLVAIKARGRAYARCDELTGSLRASLADAVYLSVDRGVIPKLAITAYDDAIALIDAPFSNEAKLIAHGSSVDITVHRAADARVTMIEVDDAGHRTRSTVPPPEDEAGPIRVIPHPGPLGPA